jgi:hypothetical protein
MARFGKLDGPVFALPDISPTFFVLSHEDVESDLWMRLWFAPLILHPLARFQTFGLNHPQMSLLSYDNLFPFG